MKRSLRLIIAAAMLTTGGAITIAAHDSTSSVAGAHHFTQVGSQIGGHWGGRHTPAP